MNYYEMLLARKLAKGELPPNAYLLKTASGSLVSFSDGTDLPMPSFICNIDAVQDLHGYDAPWVGGAGKNKLSIADKTATTVDNLTITPNKDADGNINGIKLNGSLTRNSYGYEFFEEILPAGSYILNADFGALTQSRAQILLYSNDYATTYAFVRPSAPSTSFTLSNDTKIRAQIYTYKDYNYSNIIIKPMLRLSTETDATFAPYSNICPISGHTGVDAVISPTTEASAGTTYSVSWQTEAGEVFGGYVDLVSGVLTVTHKKLILTTSMQYVYSNATGRVFLIVNDAVADSGDLTFRGYCNVFKSGLGTENNVISYINSSSPGFAFKGDNINSVTDFIALLNNISIEVVYELATPITYQLTPTQIKSLLGNNNAWCSTGDATLEYFGKGAE